MTAADSDRILDAALALAGTQGWRETGLHAIAAKAGLSVAGLRRHFPDKRALLSAIAARFDRNALAAMDPDLDDPSLPPPERLFDALMTRFELLQEHRDGYIALLAAARCNPVMALGGAPRLFEAMGDILRAAGMDAPGPAGWVRRKVLAMLYLSVVRVWMEDRSDDLGPTMSTLDNRLRKLDGLASSLPGMRRRGQQS